MAPLSVLSVAVTEVMMKTNFVEVCYLAVTMAGFVALRLG